MLLIKTYCNKNPADIRSNSSDKKFNQIFPALEQSFDNLTRQGQCCLFVRGNLFLTMIVHEGTYLDNFINFILSIPYQYLMLGIYPIKIIAPGAIDDDDDED